MPKTVDYEALAGDVLARIGKEANTAQVVRCATRLRFNLKDRSRADKEAVNSNGAPRPPPTGSREPGTRMTRAPPSRTSSSTLSAAGVEPIITMYHFDLPQALQEVGGWASRRTVEGFVRLARAVRGGRLHSALPADRQ